MSKIKCKKSNYSPRKSNKSQILSSWLCDCLVQRQSQVTVLDLNCSPFTYEGSLLLSFSFWWYLGMDFCKSVHFNSWITSLKLGLHGTNLTTAMKRKSSAGFSVWLLLTFAFTALTYLASLPFTDSVGQAKLETDHTPRFLNNKAENYPFHTRLHKVMVNWQMVTSQSGSLRVYTVPAVDVIWENFP